MKTWTPSPIAPPCEESQTAARARQARLTKPAGSLGRLEDLACRFAGFQRRERPQPPQAAITVFAADHGVTAEGVSAYPSAVTAEMVKNFVAGGAAICVLARAEQARLEVVDVGVDADLSALPIVHAKVRRGSGNLRREAAMTPAECAAALAVGQAAARRAVEAGATLLIAGEMGIGNTTPSAALLCALTGALPEVAVGRGTGVDDSTLAHKRRVVADALARFGQRRQPRPLDVLAELGGLEIAAMAGFYLEGAASGVPLLVDGFIATAAALAAVAIDAAVAPWLLASHRSDEAGHGTALWALGLDPLVGLGLRLGEGTGAAVCLPLIRLALTLHDQMATFDEAGVSGRDA
ncbi:nicotinate-nucleotide--dimethylbenzimidazole phosphoribosyltransferase [Gulbenkiania mobilis]|uniref:nicotinate-nucleotide--dimethylbenzimidazole phosphoribosyltransferase n=1 Tax=Gulbenkiania mobilis TaxID=397457 RepID=UPI0006BBCF00|nr:nicotinate-nucleotide--dimethylbenzimidazole phosphoribosyltransferase [Gulbenkiania mobilis]